MKAKVNTIAAVALLLSAQMAAADIVSFDSSVTINTVSVGDAGNAADSTGHGAVDYEYNIGKFEVTNAQYAAFLNAVAKTDPYGLYNTDMSDSASNHGGIVRSGSDGNYTYSAVSGRENLPVNLVSLYDAARFCNWLTTGDTEKGVYNSLNGQSTSEDMSHFARDSEWVSKGGVFIPNENEWYKAAYYNPSDSSYYQYATSSNSAPSATLDFAADNAANYAYCSQDLTIVGSYVNSASAYGTYDQNGNVSEWIESSVGSFATLRGGSLTDGDSYLSSGETDYNSPENEAENFGFRVANLNAVPEPGSCAALAGVCALAAAAVVRGRKRRIF